jgi:hypothetical protein
MKRLFYTSVLLILLGACSHEDSSQATAPASHVNYIKNKTIRMMNHFKCDSVNSRHHSINAYFSHSKNNFDELQTEQFTQYAITLLEFDITQIDTLIYHYSSKHMNVAQKTKIETFDDFYKKSVMYSALKMQPILNKIFLYERSSEDNLFLNDLNKEFAVAKFGDEISKRAIIGIDAIKIIYDYITEHRNDELDENNVLFKTYEKRISTKTGELKEMHEKLLHAIHEAVEE